MASWRFILLSRWGAGLLRRRCVGAEAVYIFSHNQSEAANVNVRIQAEDINIR